jgi:DnaK suppressor protein
MEMAAPNATGAQHSHDDEPVERVPEAVESAAPRSVDEIERLLEGVEAALGRLDEGTYGVCAFCGSPIPDERLAASPTATRCSVCDPEGRQA